jgi:hypothetical protein
MAGCLTVPTFEPRPPSILPGLSASSGQQGAPSSDPKEELARLKKERDDAHRLAADADVRVKQQEAAVRAAGQEAIQTKLYIGAGVLVAVAVILAAMAVYFRSAHIAYFSVGVGCLACLVGFAGFLLPWALPIAAVVSCALIVVLCWMLFGRDKALLQLSKGVNQMKAQVPGYKSILREHIDTAQDKIIDATRKRWGDPEV